MIKYTPRYTRGFRPGTYGCHPNGLRPVARHRLSALGLQAGVPEHNVASTHACPTADKASRTDGPRYYSFTKVSTRKRRQCYTLTCAGHGAQL
jgi:hypothetical protein